MRPADFKTEEEWRKQLILTPTFKPTACVANAFLFLEHSPAWAGVLAYDEFADCIKLMRPPPWQRLTNGSWRTSLWEDKDDIFAAQWLQHEGVAASVLTAAQAVTAVAQKARFHPIRDYLGGLKWDGTKRLTTLAHTYFGAADNPYHAAVGRCMLITGVARVMSPGCKADHVVILEAGQGKYKSSAIEALTSPWFSDDIADLGSKDAAMQVRVAWCIEIAELSAMSRPEVEKVKAFISRRTDRFRPSYGRRVIEAPRQSFFVGSTNSEQYLKDDTGGRRFWPLRCGVIDLAAVRRDKDQLWAEAVTQHRDGVKWWLTENETALAEEEQDERYVEDAWLQCISRYVGDSVEVAIDDVLSQGIEKPKERWSALDMSRVSGCLRRLGFKKKRVGGRNNRQYRYVRAAPCPTGGDTVSY